MPASRLGSSSHSATIAQRARKSEAQRKNAEAFPSCRFLNQTGGEQARTADAADGWAVRSECAKPLAVIGGLRTRASSTSPSRERRSWRSPVPTKNLIRGGADAAMGYPLP